MPACRQCQTAFDISNDDLAMLDKLSPVIAGAKHLLPPPTLCPPCRQQRRIAFRNDRNFYRNACSLCKKSIISIYSPDKNLPVLCHDCFWSDRWDPLQYGIDIDLNVSFFEQFDAMRSKVPRLAIFNTQSENSEYSVHASKNKNCYMGSSIGECEDVYYGDWVIRCRDCMDILMCTDMELCYECSNSRECFNTDFAELSSGLSDCFLCFDCHRSNQLVGCASVRGGTAMILNEQSTPEECKQTVERLKKDRAFRRAFDQKFQELKQRLPKRDAWNTNAEGCTGNYITNSKNARHAFYCEQVEDGTHVFDTSKAKDVCDITRCWNVELLYECKGIVDLKYSCFCNLTYQCDNMLYCDNCSGSSECFGCMSLKKNRYCILNKQYTKEEYERLVPQIIERMKTVGEWGEFFPITLSAFGYNESKAQESYPLTRAEAMGRGWKWSNYEQSAPSVQRTIPAKELPGDIRLCTDEILQHTIRCEVTGKPFKIIAQELAFYRKKGLPLPTRSPLQRHLDRVAQQNPYVLHDRQCGKCQKAIQTTYAPDRPEIVYCEECYLKEVY